MASYKINPRFSVKDRRAYWMGVGARLVRHRTKHSNSILTRIFKGRFGQSFKNGIKRADRMSGGKR